MTQQMFIIWAAAAIATFSGLVGCTAKGAADAIASTRTVQVTRVQMAILDNTLRAVGLLSPKDEARLSFKVGGLVESIKVEEGQAVKAGQPLARIDNRDFSAALDQARADVTAAQAAVAKYFHPGARSAEEALNAIGAILDHEDVVAALTRKMRTEINAEAAFEPPLRSMASSDRRQKA